jgi:hypothetical protein
MDNYDDKNSDGGFCWLEKNELKILFLANLYKKHSANQENALIYVLSIIKCPVSSNLDQEKI